MSSVPYYLFVLGVDLKVISHFCLGLCKEQLLSHLYVYIDNDEHVLCSIVKHLCEQVCGNCKGLSSLGTGAPTLSASGSTLSKCLGMEKYWGGRGLIGGSIEVLPSTPSQGNFEGDGTSNPFDSKCSTVGAPCLKQTETSTPQSMASLLQGRDVGVLAHQSVVEWTEVPPKTVLNEKAVKLDDVTGDASPEAPTTMEAPAMTGDASPEAPTSTVGFRIIQVLLSL